MADDLRPQAGDDHDSRRRIDIDQEHQVRSWAKRLGVSSEEVKDAVRTVGDAVEDVEAFLKGGGNRVP